MVQRDGAQRLQNQLDRCDLADEGKNWGCFEISLVKSAINQDNYIKMWQLARNTIKKERRLITSLLSNQNTNLMKTEFSKYPIFEYYSCKIIMKTKCYIS
jgi:hypothetical protein